MWMAGLAYGVCFYPNWPCRSQTIHTKISTSQKRLFDVEIRHRRFHTRDGGVEKQEPQHVLIHCARLRDALVTGLFVMGRYDCGLSAYAVPTLCACACPVLKIHDACRWLTEKFGAKFRPKIFPFSFFFFSLPFLRFLTFHLHQFRSGNSNST